MTRRAKQAHDVTIAPVSPQYPRPPPAAEALDIGGQARLVIRPFLVFRQLQFLHRGIEAFAGIGGFFHLRREIFHVGDVVRDVLLGAETAAGIGMAGIMRSQSSEASFFSDAIYSSGEALSGMLRNWTDSIGAKSTTKTRFSFGKETGRGGGNSYETNAAEKDLFHSHARPIRRGTALQM